MKRKQLILACMVMAMAISASAQITTRHAADKVIDKVNLPPYDSTKNFLEGKNVYSYIGQILYVNGIPDMGVSLQDHGYQNFYKVKEPVDKLFKFRSNLYGKLSKKGGGTRYEDLFGKYFIVRDVQPDSRTEEEPLLYDWYWFLLENRDDPSDIAWFQYYGSMHSSRDFPFIVVSHFNYIKSLYVGKTYISAFNVRKDGSIMEWVGEYDYNTGKKISGSKDNEWTCVDLIIEDKNFQICVELQDKYGQTTVVKVDDLKFLEKANYRILEKKRYQEMCALYGQETMEAVRQHKMFDNIPSEIWSLTSNVTPTSEFGGSSHYHHHHHDHDSYDHNDGTSHHDGRHHHHH